MTAIRREPFNRDHARAVYATNGRDAGADHVIVDVHGARTAQRLTTPVFGARQVQHVAQHPEQRHLGVDLEAMLSAVDAKCDGHGLSPCDGHSAPVFTQASISAPNCACVPGAGSRSWPGCQPQPTSSSWALCSTICASDFPPLRLGSFICSQM